MASPPTGNVTFLFTDIEGSTKLAQEFPESLHAALEIHNNILTEAIESHNGFIFDIVGDAFCSSFEKPEDAVKASNEILIKLNSHKWDEAEIKVRIGIHSGKAEWNGVNYMGYLTLARTHRIMSVGYGGQILSSDETYNSAKEKVHEAITFRDLGERRLKDLIQPMRIYQVVHSDLPSEFPQLKTLDARPNNLPVQLTSFVGRVEEIKKIKGLLYNTHLLTLTGMGGVGKTRLAMQIAADVIDDFTNGVWIVELASITDPALLPQAIAQALGVKEDPKKGMEDSLIDYLQDKEMLIILDNCEHIIEACAQLVEKLLIVNQNLKIIATSREVLKCSGEQVHHVSSLTFHDPKKKITPEKLTQYEGIRLFIERALAVNPSFRVTNENATALAEICFQLDGIPLAIELAAARIKVLSVEKIFERLSNRFTLLTGGKRTALPRQQTLKAMIDWSHDLLSEKEKILLRRLSVFSGGWTLEASEEVCSDEKVSESDILDLLSNLSEKSIIIYDEKNDRYRMLETLRQYSKEKLIESNEEKIILNKHLEFYLQLSETAEPNLKGIHQKEWLERLEDEHGNFQSSLSLSLEAGKNEEGVRMAAALGRFWLIRGYLSSGRRWMESVLFNTSVSKIARGNALNLSGLLAYGQGDYKSARKLYEESLSLRREYDDKKPIAETLSNLADVAYSEGEYEQANKLCEENLTLQRELGDKRSIALSLNTLGMISYSRGNYEKAQTLFQESLDIRSTLGDKRSIAYSLNNLGLTEFSKGSYDRSEQYYKESLDLQRELGNKQGIAASLHNLGLVSYFQNEYERAREFYEESLTIHRELGDKRGISSSLYNIGNVDIHYGETERAKKLCEESLSLRWEIGDKLALTESLILYSEILTKEGLNIDAVRILSTVDTAFKSMGISWEGEYKLKYDRIISSAKAKLSEEEFSKYLEKGKGMSMDETVKQVLSSQYVV